MEHDITIVGLDAHKNSIEIATAETAGSREVRHYGKIGGDMTSLDKAIRKLRSVRSNGAEPVNNFWTLAVKNYCRSFLSPTMCAGGLIHAASGKAGGTGTPLTNRSG